MSESTELIPRDPHPALPSGNEMLAALEKASQQGEAAISLNYSDNGWVVGIHFGKEAEDSDMWGGAAYGMGETLPEALATALEDTGWLEQDENPRSASPAHPNTMIGR